MMPKAARSSRCELKAWLAIQIAGTTTSRSASPTSSRLWRRSVSFSRRRRPWRTSHDRFDCRVRPASRAEPPRLDYRDFSWRRERQGGSSGSCWVSCSSRSRLRSLSLIHTDRGDRAAYAIFFADERPDRSEATAAPARSGWPTPAPIHPQRRSAVLHPLAPPAIGFPIVRRLPKMTLVLPSRQARLPPAPRGLRHLAKLWRKGQTARRRKEASERER